MVSFNHGLSEMKSVSMKHNTHLESLLGENVIGFNPHPAGGGGGGKARPLIFRT